MTPPPQSAGAGGWTQERVGRIWRIMRIAYACCLCVAAAYVVTTTVSTTFRTASPIIFWDAWQWIALLKSWIEDGFNWPSLFAVQNEHQIAVQRILLLADYYVSNGTNFPLIFLNVALFVIAILGLFKLVTAAVADGRNDRIDLIAYLAFVSIVMFAAPNIANLNWGFIVSFVASTSLIVVAVLAAISAAKATQHGDTREAWGWLAGALAIAIIASFSGANGILTWPVVFVILALGGLPRSQLAGFALIGAAVAVVYVVELHFNSLNADPRLTWRNPATYLQYLQYFLGNTIADEHNPTRNSLILGWIGLLGSLVAGLIFVRNRKSWNVYQVGLLGVLVFELATGAMIALTRQNWGGALGMVVDRYRLADAIFWSAAIGLLFSASWPRPILKEAARVAAAGIMAWVTIAVVAYQAHMLEKYIDRYAKWEIAADALRMQIMDKPALSAVMFPDASMIPLINFIRQRHLSVFADGRFEKVGNPLSDLYQVATNAPCEGGVRNVAAVDGEIYAWRAAGQAWDPLEKREPAPFVFVDNASKKIIGLASSTPSRPFFTPSRDSSKTNGWEGYFRAPPKSTVSLYGLRGDKATVCYIATLTLK